MALPVSSNITSFCANSADAICSAPDTASTLTEQLDGVKSQFADEFAESCGLPPDHDTAIEHVIPLQTDAKPPFKPMHCLSPSKLVEVKRQATELLQKQLIEPVTPSGAHFSWYSWRGVSCA